MLPGTIAFISLLKSIAKRLFKESNETFNVCLFLPHSKVSQKPTLTVATKKKSNQA